MPTKNTQPLVREYLERFPSASTQAVARILFRDHGLLWPSLDACNSAVRYTRGSMGQRCRKYRKVPQSKAASFPAKIPPGLKELGDWHAEKIEGRQKILVLSDIHIPYHDESALEAALDFGEKTKPSVIIFNGDALDCYAVSKWENDPRLRDFPNELDTCRQVFGIVRRRFPRARLLFKLGNHEERYERYLSTKAPELLGVEEFRLSNLLKCGDLRMQVIQDKRPILAGKLYIIHGHEFSWCIASPVNPARGFYLRAKDHCIGGHLHHTSQHSEGGISGKVVSCWSTGCLCDLHPGYRPINNWNHGFALIHQCADGTFEVENPRIVEGKIYG